MHNGKFRYIFALTACHWAAVQRTFIHAILSVLDLSVHLFCYVRAKTSLLSVWERQTLFRVANLKRPAEQVSVLSTYKRTNANLPSSVSGKDKLRRGNYRMSNIYICVNTEKLISKRPQVILLTPRLLPILCPYTPPQRECQCRADGCLGNLVC